jgi:hypothetical protein
MVPWIIYSLLIVSSIMNLWLLREYKILMRRRTNANRYRPQAMQRQPQQYQPQMDDYDSLLKRMSFEQPDYSYTSGDFMSNMILKRNVTPYMASNHGNFNMVDNDIYGNSLKPSLIF